MYSFAFWIKNKKFENINIAHLARMARENLQLLQFQQSQFLHQADASNFAHRAIWLQLS